MSQCMVKKKAFASIIFLNFVIHQSLQQKEDELRKLELQRQTLQCTVELEREKQTTLECDLQKVQEKLQHALALGSKLEGEKNELADDLKFKVGFLSSTSPPMALFW